MSERSIVQRQGYIVVVEPDDLIRGLLERWLGEAGYTVAVEALRDPSAPLVRHGMAQLVIADVPTPRSAERLIQYLREEYASPILIVSARLRRGLEASDELARRLGVRRVLPKPFSRKELLTAVEESMNRDGD
jgi:DNA-binding response OmpR family regulator